MPQEVQSFSQSLMIRRACVLASVLALILQGSSGGHMLLVEHTRCAEHGELVHSGDAYDHASGEHAHSKTATLDGLPDPDSDEAHDHCVVPADRRDAAASFVDSKACICVAGLLDDLTLNSAVLVPSTPRFRIAPKGSPPA